MKINKNYIVTLRHIKMKTLNITLKYKNNNSMFLFFLCVCPKY